MSSLFHDLLECRLDGLGMSAAELLARDAPGGLSIPGRSSANRHCRLLSTNDGWVALNLARDEDRELVPALTDGSGDGWEAVADWSATLSARAIRERAVLFQLPIAELGEAVPQALASVRGAHAPPKVLDMSALWAGPLCAGLLARAGSEVLRIASVGRPDPTPFVSPRLDVAINAGKTVVALDLRDDAGKEALHRMIEEADVLVTSARASALARLGLVPERFPHLTWVAVTAHGFAGDGAERVGFGDDCAVAGGLVDWRAGEPNFLGDALGDPLTGLEAARRVFAGERGLIDVAMAGVASAYARMLA